MSLVQTLTDTLSPMVQTHGFRLWDLKVTKAGKRSIVTITLDKAGGAKLDEIAEMSKEIAPLLDENDSLGDSYHLEVASPGLERALVRPDHFQWSLGMNITVSYRLEGTLTRVRGKLSSVGTVDISVDTGDEALTIPFDAITKAHTIFDFDAAMKKGTAQDLVSQEETA